MDLGESGGSRIYTGDESDLFEEKRGRFVLKSYVDEGKTEVWSGI